MNDQQLWSINESLLQSYRSVFISSQAFLLAVGAIVADKGMIVLLPVAGIALLVIWTIWVPVVVSRHRIVDYYKYQSRSTQKAQIDLCTETEYVKRKAKRQEANDALGIETNWRPTRRKIDFYIPLLYTLVWVVLVIYGAMGQAALPDSAEVHNPVNATTQFVCWLEF